MEIKHSGFHRADLSCVGRVGIGSKGWRGRVLPGHGDEEIPGGAQGSHRPEMSGTALIQKKGAGQVQDRFQDLGAFNPPKPQENHV